ncbi:MAG TPA: enoyl-CoA hydratase-related protein [Ktedonobacteraceae bacterium]|nr:enoyl-CoA hydratase-related protein [Ktedonobacteraceae bacterium]
MQQAYQAIRIVSEAQTIRVGLSTDPDELMLRELCTACSSLASEASSGIKALVLDFKSGSQTNHASAPSSVAVEMACEAVRVVTQPVLAVARDTLSPAACKLLPAADLTLVSEYARLIIEDSGKAMQEDAMNRVPTTGAHAARLGYVTWSVPAGDISKEMERILNMLREKSAVALRYAKAATRLGQTGQATPLEALQRINSLYLDAVMQTEDAHEGLRAFLEKRKPQWKNK